jgi:hypothetical protein
MIEGNLGRELGGAVEMDFAPEGITCAISCPIGHPERTTVHAA